MDSFNVQMPVVDQARGGFLLVASTGGHLSELHQLRDQVVLPHDSVTWVTFDSLQSRSLLSGERVDLLEEIPSRGYLPLIRSLPGALRIMWRRRPRCVVSSGAGIALIFLPFAFLFGAKAMYVESAARPLGPSLTGRLVSLFPWVEVYTQFERNAGRRWRFKYSILAAIGHGKDLQPLAGGEPVRVLVLLGTLHFPFERIVQRVRSVMPVDAEIIWQLGQTPDAPGPHRSFSVLPVDELEALAQKATMIISHAGVGSALMALNAGIKPILVPRRLVHGEHIDDHQVEVAQELEGMGVALYREVDDIDCDMFAIDYRFPVQRSAAPDRRMVVPLLAAPKMGSQRIKGQLHPAQPISAQLPGGQRGPAPMSASSKIGA